MIFFACKPGYRAQTITAITARQVFDFFFDGEQIIRGKAYKEIEYRDRELSRWQKAKHEAGGIAIGACIALMILTVFLIIHKFK